MILFAAFVLSAALATLPAAEATNKVSKVITGKCVGVHDGDTITVLTGRREQVKVRLHGIDAPELGQDYGDRSRRGLSSKVFGRDVSVAVVNLDRNGRTVGDVYRGDRWVNLELVAEGLAWHYAKFSTSEELAKAQADARQKRLGLWRDKEPTPPWEFRKEEKEDRVEREAANGTGR